MTNKNNNLIIGIVVVIAVLIILGSFGGYGIMRGSNFGFGSLSWVLNILIIILIIIGIFWLIKHVNFNGVRIK